MIFKRFSFGIAIDLKLFLSSAMLLFGLYFTQITTAQNTNITFRSQLTYNDDMSDIWGYEINGFEYAIATVANGVSIVDVTDPDNINEIFWVDGPSTFWRDPKTWGNFVYITNEANGGLQIIDLSALPVGNINNSDVYYWTGGDFQGNNVNFNSAHNIFIDENGIGYIVGADYGAGGAIMIDLNANPINPPIVGIYNERYVHDAFARGDTLWTGEINNGIFSVIDVSDKANPVVLATQATTSNFTHNIWASDDGNYVFTTDETSNANIDSYDVSTTNDIQLIDTYQSNPGSNAIPHNVFVKDKFIFISYYRDGVVLLDSTFPDNLIEVGNCDTSPNFNGNGFNGCWGVYPYLPSGTILATDIEEGLYVLSPNYLGACFLQGVVTDAQSGAVIPNATISILENATASTNTDFNGNYTTGTASTGTYTLNVSQLGYETQTITVFLSNGVIEVLDIMLTPITPFIINGQITDNLDGTGIDGANVLLINDSQSFTTTTDAQGNFSANVLGTGIYSVYAGHWGHITNALENTFFDDNNTNVTLALNRGYYDDFTFDFNWNENSDANAGIWELGEPIGTNYNGTESNPDLDIPTDFIDQCYVTGNGGGGAGNDDVDNGTTILTSPIFDLSTYANPELSYYRWFYNDGGNSDPDDEMVIRISNGSTSVVIETIADNDPFEGVWQQNTITITDYITLTNNMQFIVEASDLNDGHIVEAGLDGFEIADMGVVNLLTITGQVIDAATNMGVSNANVLLEGTGNLTTITDTNGNFSFTVNENSNYTIYAGQWSYITNTLGTQTFDANNTTLLIALEQGYYDDFLFDFGWTTNGDASTGFWLLDQPIGTFSGNDTANPANDIDNDYGTLAYVTGNTDDNNAGTDDIDGGTVILTSPVFDLSNYGNAELSYYRWFHNSGGNTTPDDTMIVVISNGITSVTLETITNDDPFESQWQQQTFVISDYLTPTANMQLIATASDLGNGHLVEGGIDGFVVVDLGTPPPTFVLVQAQVFLEGAYTGAGIMSTALNSLLPLNQPYNIEPWLYTGNEALASNNDIPNTIVDWVLLEVRDANNNNTIIERRAAFVRNDGTLVDIDASVGVKFYFINADTNYHLLVRHRNHLDIISTDALSLPNSMPFNFADATLVQNGAEQMKNLGDGNYALRAGDFSGNSVITVEDFNLYATQAAIVNQYIEGDCSLDGNSTVIDFNLYQPNASIIGVSAVRY